MKPLDPEANAEIFGVVHFFGEFLDPNTQCWNTIEDLYFSFHQPSSSLPIRGVGVRLFF